MLEAEDKIRGFTLGEVLVGATIIVLISSVVLLSVSEARKKARDDRRTADLSQVQLALRLYKEANGKYPGAGDVTSPFSVGVDLGKGGTIDALLKPYIENVPHDPLGADNHDYRYAYQSSKTCRIDGELHEVVVIFAKKTETGDGNWPDVCGGFYENSFTRDFSPQPETYAIILEDLGPAATP